MNELGETTRWWWIRHAPVESGGRIYGHNDLPANCTDETVFKGLARMMPERAVWVTSHLQRTSQTAQAIHAQRTDGARDSGQMLVEPRFAEQHFGDWQGLTHAEIAERRGGEWHRFWLSPAEQVPPGGESFVQLIDRVGAAIAELSEVYAGRDIVAVTHGGTIRAALSLALTLAPDRALSFSVDNCSLTRIDRIAGAPGSHAPDHPEAWRVAAVNLLPGAAA